MEIVSDAITLVKYAVLGFFGLVAGLFVLALLFGKRVEKRYELEAKFRDARGRELGEFDIELSRVIEKKAAVQPDFSLKACFVLRHPSLEPGRKVCVKLGGLAVFESPVVEAGRIRLREGDLIADIKSPEAGQKVSVEVGGEEIFSETLYND